MALYDIVQLKVDVPEYKLLKGSIGSIVYIFDELELAFEVEFIDSKGKTIVILTLNTSQIELVDGKIK